MNTLISDQMMGKFSKANVLMAISLMFLGIACNFHSNSGQKPAEDPSGIIPRPKKLEFSADKITINHNLTFVRNYQFPIASAVAEELIKNTVNSFKISDTIPSQGITLQLILDKGIKEEAYELSVTTGGILVKAGTESGVFWALQSLRQYLWKSTNGNKQDALELGCISIADEPAYRWRGFHLDVSRHFFTKAYILRIIDWISYYKYNKLHLHLTDDEGWRIESKKFPLLNTIGSWRIFDHNDSICMRKAKSDPEFEIDPRFIHVRDGKTMYGGYYTQQDLKEIIEYAKAHFIEIIPEVDMPGHMSAAIQVFPQLSCTGSTGWGTKFSYPVCPCNDEAFNLVYQIWDEIAEIFPSSYVHIGADEVEKDTWKSSPACKDFMKANNLKDEKEIQSFFVEKLQKHLEAKGKTVIAWDDVTVGKLDNNLKIMYWRDFAKDAPAIAAANGNEIIFTRWDLFYLSYATTDDKFKKLLQFDINLAYPPEVAKKVIGFQGCVWTEEIPSEASFESHVFPRLQALSEVNWSSDKDLNSFNKRMEPHLQYLKANHVNIK
jgi:hexosaminidase